MLSVFRPSGVADRFLLWIFEKKCIIFFFGECGPAQWLTWSHSMILWCFSRTLYALPRKRMSKSYRSDCNRRWTVELVQMRLWRQSPNVDTSCETMRQAFHHKNHQTLPPAAVLYSNDCSINQRNLPMLVAMTSSQNISAPKKIYFRTASTDRSSDVQRTLEKRMLKSQFEWTIYFNEIESINSRT